MMARLAAALVLGVLFGAGYLLVARPYQMHRGATAAEIARAMPGDALSLRPTFLATRAITIRGTPAAIWPWLVQMGYGRAGFYGYDLIENLGSARGLRSASTIVPEFQHLEVGDPLPLSALGGLVVHAIAPQAHLVWTGVSGEYPGAFTWSLYPLDAEHTRLVSRIQWSHHVQPPSAVVFDVFTEFTDGIAVQRILRGVKGRVEGRAESFAMQNVELAVYLWALIALVTAVVVLVWRPLSRSSWLTALAAGGAWLVVWNAPIPMPVAVLMNLAVLWALTRRGAEANATRQE